MNGRKQFNSLPDMEQAMRWPRLGKIGLGVKKTSEKTGREYPAEVDYFVLDEPGDEAPQIAKAMYAKFREVYGEKPKFLNVVLPCEDRLSWFPQALKCYGGNGRLKCIGNGAGVAQREKSLFPANEQAGKIEGQLYDWFDCPCDLLENGECKRMGNLMVILPDVCAFGVWQIDTSSFHSIRNVNSEIELVRATFGRVSQLVDPEGQSVLILTREPQETMFGGKRATHYVLHMRIRRMSQLDYPAVMRLRAHLASLPTPTQALLPQPSPETELIPGNASTPTTVDAAQEPKPTPVTNGKRQSFGLQREAPQTCEACGGEGMENGCPKCGLVAPETEEPVPAPAGQNHLSDLF